MEAWRDHISSLFDSFEYQDLLQKTLVEIDKNIIDDKNINDIIKLGYQRICKITGAEFLVFHIGNDEVFIEDKCRDYKSVRRKVPVEIDKEQEDWGTYIDSVTLCFRDTADNFKGLTLDTEAVSSITRQLNIAITRDVENGVNELYRVIIRKFSKLGDIYRVFDTFCFEIVKIFPDITGIVNPEIEKSNIQIALFENKDSNYLKGVGSSNKYCAGGIIDEKHSITGRIFSMLNGNYHENGYHDLRHNKLRYIYFLDDPLTNKHYKRVTQKKSRSQLSIPLFLVDKDNNSYPFAAINLESDSLKTFKNLHAKSIIYNAPRLADLIYSVWNISQGRKHIVEGFFINNDRYIQHILKEYEHRTGHALLALSTAKRFIDKGQDNSDIVNEIEQAYKHIENDKIILKNALKGIFDKTGSVLLSKKVMDAKHFISDMLEQEEIEFIFEPNDVSELCLDNLFSQYLYSLFYNSVSSIVRKKNRIKSSFDQDQKHIYKPYIKLSAKVIADTQNTSFDEVPVNTSSFKSSKCKISIEDNGDGIEREKLPALGRYRRSFHGNAGTGLYSFKQYLLLHDARIYFDSVLNDYFRVDFIVDIPDLGKENE